jgi:N-acetylneuraminic acid mutarotase
MSITKNRFKILGSLLLALMLSISCITPALAEETEPAWTAVASMSTARSQFCSAVVNGKIYVIGGSTPTGSTNLVEEYNPTTDSWVTKAPLPETAYYTEAVSLNGKIYVIGGMAAIGYLNNMYIYSPETDTWTTKSLSLDRVFSQLEVIDEKIYVVGGINASGVLNSVTAYDPITDTWTTKAPMTTARQHFKTAVVNGKIYAIGGLSTNITSSVLNSVEVYDPATNTWTVKASMNTSRHYHELAVINNKIYVVGGSTTNTTTNSVEVYDPATNAWTNMASMATGRTQFQLVELNGNLYAIGGKASNTLASVEQYNPETNIWTARATLATARYVFQAVVTNNAIYSIGGFNTDRISSVEKYSLTSVPSAPTSLTATAGDAKVDLSWGAVTGATGYNVYRSTTSGGTYTKIAEGITATTYTDSTVTNGTTYYYVVSAVTSGIESAYSNEASATPKKSQSEAGFAILDIYMVDGTLKEYDLTMAKVNEFIEWYDQRAAGTGKSYFIIEKTYNKGPFKVRKDYIIFDKVKDFEVNQYD